MKKLLSTSVIAAFFAANGAFSDTTNYRYVVQLHEGVLGPTSEVARSTACPENHNAISAGYDIRSVEGPNGDMRRVLRLVSSAPVVDYGPPQSANEWKFKFLNRSSQQLKFEIAYYVTCAKNIATPQAVVYEDGYYRYRDDVVNADRDAELTHYAQQEAYPFYVFPSSATGKSNFKDLCREVQRKCIHVYDHGKRKLSCDTDPKDASRAALCRRD